MSGTGVEKRGEWRSVFTRAGIGGAAGVIVTLLLMLGVSALIAGGKIPMAYGGRCVVVCTLLGAALAAFVTAARRGRGVLTVGLLCGVAYVAVLVVLSLFSGGTQLFGTSFLKIAISAIGGGAFGGALCLRKKSRSKSRRRGR